MEKVCKNCKQVLVVGDNWTLSNKKIYAYKCSSCIATYRKERYNKPGMREKILTEAKVYRNTVMKDGKVKVYVTDHNYAGVYTQTSRILAWKRKGIQLRIIYETKDPFLARELEDLLHDIGYKGRGGNHNGNIAGITSSLDTFKEYN